MVNNRDRRGIERLTPFYPAVVRSQLIDWLIVFLGLALPIINFAVVKKVEKNKTKNRENRSKKKRARTGTRKHRLEYSTG